MKVRLIGFGVFVSFVLCGVVAVRSQTQPPRQSEHVASILGVTIGMTVPEALETVFVNAKLKPGQEKPDAKRSEGEDKKDVRVVYKKLDVGELQILFAGGTHVAEVTLSYTNPPLVDDLRLPETGSLGNSTSLITTSTVGRDGQLSGRTEVLDGTKEIDGFNAANLSNIDRRRGEALEGKRLDDRYSVAFADGLKQQKVWWRMEKSPGGYSVSVQFVSEKRTKAGADFVLRVEQKTVMVAKDDIEKFRLSIKK